MPLTKQYFLFYFIKLINFGIKVEGAWEMSNGD